MSRQKPDIVPPQPAIRVAVSMPTHSVVPFGFAYDLAKMTGWSTASIPGSELSIILNASEGTYIHMMRQSLVQSALETDSTHILFLDTDMMFPQETLLHLLSRKEPIVGINYAQRRIPTKYVAVKKRAGPNMDPIRLVTDDESTRLEEVESVGFGVILIELGVFDKLGKPPWFQNIWDADTKRWVGEDTYFCLKAREAGFKILVDHDLSKRCHHIGQISLGCEHAFACLPQETDDGNRG